ncbi:hypothetical protein RB213_011412, partial [Colletotrichum asianum]
RPGSEGDFDLPLHKISQRITELGLSSVPLYVFVLSQSEKQYIRSRSGFSRPVVVQAPNRGTQGLLKVPKPANHGPEGRARRSTPDHCIPRHPNR